MKTAEEILSKHVNCLDSYAQKDNMIKAMEEHTSQQLAEREKEIEWLHKKSLESNDTITTLEKQIQSLKEEVERISEVNRKFIDDCILKATIDKDNRIKELQEEVEGLKKHLETRGDMIHYLESTITTQAEEIKKLKEGLSIASARFKMAGEKLEMKGLLEWSKDIDISYLTPKQEESKEGEKCEHSYIPEFTNAFTGRAICQFCGKVKFPEQ